MGTAEEIREQIKAVNAAIMAIVTGAQSYTIDGKTLTRADLSKLYEIKQDLETSLAREEAGGILITYANIGRV